VLLAALASGHDMCEPGLAATLADHAAAAVAKAFRPQHTFAFQHTGNGVAADEPGFLTGAAGIALALADHGDLPVPPVPARWDAVLLLS
jgi:hypothetical protein